jgi:hypothetical protein
MAFMPFMRQAEACTEGSCRELTHLPHSGQSEGQMRTDDSKDLLVIGVIS